MRLRNLRGFHDVFLRCSSGIRIAREVFDSFATTSRMILMWFIHGEDVSPQLFYHLSQPFADDLRNGIISSLRQQYLSRNDSQRSKSLLAFEHFLD